MWSMTLCEGESNIFLLNSDAMIHTISQFCPQGSWHWSPHLFKSKRNSCWDRARSTSIISIKIFLVVLIVDSFSEALLSTSPAWTVPANVQITATQLFFHYRLCKTNYYYHYYYYYYYYHCYYFHYYYHYIHYKTNYYLLLWNCSSRSVLLQISLLSVTVIRQCSAGVSFYAKTKISISDGNIYDPHTPHYLCFRIFSVSALVGCWCNALGVPFGHQQAEAFHLLQNSK